MTTTYGYHLKRLGEGFGVYRRATKGDVHEDSLIRRFALDEFREASSFLKGLNESEPLQRIRAELMARARNETSLDRLTDALKSLTTIAPQYDADRPFRSINARVPASALAAIDGRLEVDEIDEEVA